MRVILFQPQRADASPARTSLADLESRGVAYNTKKNMVIKKGKSVNNAAMETFAYTKSVLANPWPAASNNNRTK